MRCLVSSFHALNRRTLAKTGGQHQHKIYAMSAATSRRATTQVSEFAQRQLNEGVIDMAAGQVSCKRSPPPPAWRIGGRGMPCAQALQHSWVDICYPASSWLCCQTIHLICMLQPGPDLLPLQHIAAAAADRLTGAKADPFILQVTMQQPVPNLLQGARNTLTHTLCPHA